MTQSAFLALITPIGNGGGSQPPEIWRPTFPTNPIVVPPGGAYPPGGGQPPLGIWGPIGNYPDAGFPGPQPGGPVYPSHPIYYPGARPSHPIYYPPEISGGPINPYPDIGFPGPQPGGPVRPTHPIYYPPVIWDPSRPTNPIVNPGDPNNPAAGQPGGEPPKIEWKTAWSPTTGWIVVGIPTGEHVTPSKEETPPA